MLLPLQIDQHNRKKQWATWLIILINIAVFLWQLQIPLDYAYKRYMDMLVVPVNVVANPLSLETVFDIMRSAFMHAGWSHLIGNMLFLNLFGTNVERKIGSWLFLFLYFIAAISSAMLHVIFFANTINPLIGASGAIAGMMGMFLILFPKEKIRGLFPLGAWLYPFLAPFMGAIAPALFFLFMPMAWSAWIFLGLMLLRDISGAADSLTYASMGGVAHFGHLGGFIAGIFFGMMIRLAIVSKSKRAWESSIF